MVENLCDPTKDKLGKIRELSNGLKLFLNLAITNPPFFNWHLNPHPPQELECYFKLTDVWVWYRLRLCVLAIFAKINCHFCDFVLGVVLKF